MTHSGERSPRSSIAGWLRTQGFLLLASAIGLLALLSPLLTPLVQQDDADTTAHSGDAPVLFAIITICTLLATMLVVADDQAGVGRAKTVALLGVLVAIDATLRIVPSFLGASPIFLLIMLVGCVFGASLGFQMGTLTLLLSAIVTGGVGPWLPFQMLAAGWVGMTAGWLPSVRNERLRIGMLAVFGAFWGLAFGFVMNLWFWPFAAPSTPSEVGLYWSPGLSFGETIGRYVRFYGVTSLGFDLFRSAGNVVLMLVLGGPILRLLTRYRSRFTWQPWEDDVAAPSGTATPGR